MSSTVFDLATVIGALDQIDSHLKSKSPWTPSGPVQERVLALRDRFTSSVARLRHLEGLASEDADELNRFLAERDFSYRFAPLNQAEFGAASAIREATVWPKPGQAVPIEIDGADWHGFLLKAHISAWPTAPGLLVRMPSSETDQSIMWVLMADQAPDGSDPLELFEFAAAALAKTHLTPMAYDSVTMPTESLQTTTELGWLKGLGRSGATITSAAQEAILRIDRLGSEAKVATAMVALRGIMVSRDLVVDRPHLVFWTDTAVPDLPLAVARFEADAWTAYDPTRAATENALPR